MVGLMKVLADSVEFKHHRPKMEEKKWLLFMNT